MSALRFAILGTGRIASDYLTALETVPELELVGLCDPRQEVVTALGERWEVQAFTEPDELFEKCSVETVLVAAPPALHESLSMDCLSRGAHVLCEKPLALDLASGRRMLAAAAEAGRVLTMSAKFRHVPDLLEAKARIESGQLGRLAFADNVFASPVSMADRWNSDPSIGGGGVLMDNGTHSVDLLRYLFGPVLWVDAVEGPRLQGLAVEDNVRLRLGFADGLVAGIDLSWSFSTFDDWYVAVHGDQGSLRLGWGGSHFERSDGTRQDFGTGYKKIQALGRQLAHFGRLAAGEESALLAQADLLASIQVVEAAYASLHRGQRVEIPASPDDS